ncbi:triose-phosphate isomerase [Halarsenatibacter silvermanii]|uniref:Triosephosphate isomerase n=1 Tax=Halarsenatibacter silvermanii TaxID=321763 RepID=A0A1G9RPP5_9FIRM|nr:triose-phosphate isomerase [Halarsenatibacter silvermanii]SDM25162.1 triosephosphate isomerase [Halarsenatibacter silvermanii]
MRRPFIAGNWKMNKTPSEARELVGELKDMVSDVDDVDMAVCPTFVAVPAVVDELEDSDIMVGAQNMYWKDSGSFTGEVSPQMLTDLDLEHVIIGHSERREYFHETDREVNMKVRKALEKGLKPIVCVGESLEEREEGRTEEKVAFQVWSALSGVADEDIPEVTIAYEPLWAIGTGESASPEEAASTIDSIRDIVEDISPGAEEKIRIQYGGSVKPHNIEDFISRTTIDGALVGGASLTAESFAGVIKKCQNRGPNR